MRCDAKCQQFPDKPRMEEREVADNVEEERLKETGSDKESLRGVLERKAEGDSWGSQGKIRELRSTGITAKREADR